MPFVIEAVAEKKRIRETEEGARLYVYQNPQTLQGQGMDYRLGERAGCVLVNLREQISHLATS